MKKNRFKYILTFLVLASLNSCFFTKKNTQIEEKNPTWAVTSYNFGGLEKMTAIEQISILRNSGYQGIVLSTATEQNFEMLGDFIQESDKYDDFKIYATFIRYNFEEPIEIREKWKVAVDEIAGRSIQLWVIFGKKIEGYDDAFVENKLKEILEYSRAQKVEVVLYPHSSCYFESAEEGMPFVERINHDSLKIAFHLYHEIRAKNGDRIGEVLKAIQHKLGAVTIAGSDSIADYTNARTRDTSTIKPLGNGTYDVKAFTKELKETGYNGSVGIMNFSIKKNPEIYLPKSRKIWDTYVLSSQQKK